MKKLLYVFVFLVVFVFGLTFAAKNPQYVNITYYFGIDLELPLILLVLTTLTAGVALGFVFASLGGFMKYRRRLRRQLERHTGQPSKPGSMAMAPRNR